MSYNNKTHMNLEDAVIYWLNYYFFMPGFIQSPKPWQCPYFLAVLYITPGSPLYYSWQANTRATYYKYRC